MLYRMTLAYSLKFQAIVGLVCKCAKICEALNFDRIELYNTHDIWSVSFSLANHVAVAIVQIVQCAFVLAKERVAASRSDANYHHN